MRPIDDNSRRTLKGSRSGERVEVFAWYDGTLTYPNPLPISSWGFDWDISRQVQTFACEVADPSGRLAPWLLSDPLGVGGAELQVRYQVGNAGLVNMGWYRIGRNAPDERWRSYIIDNRGAVHHDSAIPRDKDLHFVSGGSTISINAYDRALNAKRDRLLSPESPPSTGTPTILSEIARLMFGIAPVVTAGGVVDRNVSKNIVYERERLDAIQDLCKRIFCDYRMNGDGQMEIYPVGTTAPVETLAPGPGGLLIKVDRQQDIEGLNNIFVVDGSKMNADGSSTPVRAIRLIDSGVLDANGPHGRAAEFYSSNMITNQADADAYAEQMRRSQLTGLTTDLRVECLPMPHLQQGDWVTVANPVVDGRTVPLVGKIKTMALSGKGAPDAMKLTVQCSYWDVEAALAVVRR